MGHHNEIQHKKEREDYLIIHFVGTNILLAVINVKGEYHVLRVRLSLRIFAYVTYI